MDCGPQKYAESRTISQRHDFPRAYCLDANLSYRVASALALVEHPVIHVVEAFPHKVPKPGRCNAEDGEIAEYCAKAELVLVTTDSDFQGRWVRSQLLARHGVEVIVFTEELPGLSEQHRRMTLHLPTWATTLNRDPYGYRVWTQGSKGPPKIMQGKQAKRRARPPGTSASPPPSAQSLTAAPR